MQTNGKQDGRVGDSQCSTLLFVEASDISTENLDSMPWPGEELVFRVLNHSDRRKFLESGQRSVQDLQNMLALAGRQLSDFKRILDFGCGCARVLLWLEDLVPDSELYGSDIDERMVQWGRDNVTWANFTVNRPLPPLDYPDGHFDLIYAASVFTHLDENYQDQWLAELRRLTSPGGMLILSVHGEYVMDLFEKAEITANYDLSISDIRNQLNDKGICFLDNDIFVGGPFPDFYHSTFHAPWYIFEHWGRYFYVRAYVSRGSGDFQDFVLLERMPDDVELNPISVSRNTSAQSPAVSGVSAETPRTAAIFLGRTKDDYRRFLERVLRRVGRKILGSSPEASQPVRSDSSERIAGGLPVTLLIERMGERINRLEADLWQALRRQDERLDELTNCNGNSEKDG